MASEATPTPETWIREFHGSGEMERWPMVLKTASGRYVGSFFVAEEGYAALIAAVTDLLDALRCTLAWCPRCQGDGELPVREYDAASNEFEETGRYDPCPTCAPARAAIRKATTSTEG